MQLGFGKLRDSICCKNNCPAPQWGRVKAKYVQWMQSKFLSMYWTTFSKRCFYQN